MKYDPLKICKAILKVASLPEIYIKIDEAINNPYSSSAMIADILMDDPALSAKLLRLSNSAFYGFASKVDTISKAVTIIGTQQLRDLVLACSVLKFFKNLPENSINMRMFWQHSIGCGLVARALSTVKRESNVERFFVAGLLHDLGRLVLLMELPKKMAEAVIMAKDENRLLYHCEKDVFGFDHATIGGVLLREWSLSDRLVEQVHYHHHPKLARKYREDANVIHIAEVITSAMHFGSSGSEMIPELDARAWEELQVDVNIIPEVIQQAKAEYEDAVMFILGND